MFRTARRFWRADEATANPDPRLTLHVCPAELAVLLVVTIEGVFGLLEAPFRIVGVVAEEVVQLVPVRELGLD